jgi:hypothetical protein
MSEDYYSNERNMKSWLNHDESELIMSWGPPQKVYSDNNGGKFIVYTENRSYVSPGYSTGNATGYIAGNTLYVDSQTTYYPAQIHQWSAYKMFRVDQYGKVISYSWKGL